MPVTLPTTPGNMAIKPFLVSFGAVLQGPLGGTAQRLNRMGDRYGLSVQLPRMNAVNAMLWNSALNAGLRGGVLCRFPQVGFAVGTPGAVLVNGAGQAGTVLNVKGATANYPFKAGQFVSIITPLRRYVYELAADSNATAGGLAALTFVTPIRLSPLNNAVVEVAQPMIEGLLDGDGREWEVDRSRLYGMSFTVREAA